jgi:hypothetical protein
MLCPGFKRVRRLGEGGFDVVYLTERGRTKMQVLALEL